MIGDDTRRGFLRGGVSLVASAALTSTLPAGAATRKTSPVKATAGPSTFGTAGKELRPLEGGREAELFQHEGHGCLTHMWFGGNFPDFGLTRLRVYVDGETTASIDMELDMGIGVGFQDPAAPWGIARMGKTGSPSGLYNTYRIPFGTSVRVTAQRAPGHDDNPLFWWIIRGSSHLPVEVGGIPLPANARLRLHKREGYDAKRLEEFILCESPQAGAVYQVTIAAKSANYNFLEAMMRAYMDGATTPLLLSSGLEDYFLGTYYFNRGRFYTPVAGLTHLDEADSSFAAYRFHDDDPLFFQRGLRLTCRCGEQVGPHIYGNPQDTTYTTYVWVYEW